MLQKDLTMTTNVKSIIKHIKATKETFLEDVCEATVRESLSKLELASLMHDGTVKVLSFEK